MKFLSFLLSLASLCILGLCIFKAIETGKIFWFIVSGANLWLATVNIIDYARIEK